MISVTRNTHMPNVDDSRCWSMLAKWCCSACSAIWISLVANRKLLFRQVLVVVGFPGHNRCLVKVVRGRRRRRHPLQSHCIPGIWSRFWTVAQRPQEVDHGQHIAHGQDRRSRGGKHVQHLELRRIGVVTAWHTHVAQNELREEGQVETYEHQERRQL